MYNIGFTTVTFRKKSVDEIIAIAKKAGVSCIEWGGDVHVPPKERENALSVRKKCDAAGIKTVSYGSYYRVGMNDMALFADVCDAAKILGAPVIRVWLGTKPSADTSEGEYSGLLDEVRRMALIAGEKKTSVAFEYHHGTFNDCACSTRRFMSDIKSKNVFTYWQPFSCDEDDENLNSALPFTVTVHVFNWDCCGRRFLMNEDGGRWKRIIDRVKESKKDCNFILEFTKDDCDECFLSDMECLKGLVG